MREFLRHYECARAGTVAVILLVAQLVTPLISLEQDIELVMPFAPGTVVRCSQGVNQGEGLPGHKGEFLQFDLDFAIPKRQAFESFRGTPVLAAAPGTAYAFCDGEDGNVHNGNHVKVAHAENLFTVYLHLLDNSFADGLTCGGAGLTVETGEPLGLADNTGTSTGDHLHFGLHRGDASLLGPTPSVQMKILAKVVSTGEVKVLSGTDFECGDPAIDHEYEAVASPVPLPPMLPDLTISKSGNPNPVDGGGTLAYTVAAQNIGSASAADVSVSDALPPGVTFQSCSIQCTTSGSTVTADLGTLNGGATTSFDIVVTAPSVSEPTQITNTATVSTTTPESDTTNNSASVTTIVNPGKITVSVSPQTVTLAPGVSQQFTASVTGTTNTTVIWSVLEGPNGGTITSDGFYAAPLTEGMFHVVATSQADPTKSATATVTVAAGSNTFVPTGSMSVARAQHTANLLTTGQVLIVGGENSSEYLATAELYDPDTGFFTLTGSMTTKRSRHTATRLLDGRVLVVGGINETGFSLSAEIFNPDIGTFEETGGLNIGRASHTATLLLDGKVLIVGGSATERAAEIYDPATETFSLTGSLALLRNFHTATLLPDGKVLVAGGFGNFGFGDASAEIYDPSFGTFTLTGAMMTGRTRHSATLLSDGRVLIAGGEEGIFAEIAGTAEIYTPPTATFSPLVNKMAVPRTFHKATLLHNSKVLITGGGVSACCATASVEFYDQSAMTFIPTDTMSVERSGHTATLLGDRRVLIAGGASSFGFHTTAEVYVPEPTEDAHLWSNRFGDMNSDVALAVAVDSSGNVLVTGFFQGTVNFGGSDLTSAGSGDIFVAKFASDGTHLWSKRFGGTEGDVGHGIAVDGSGHVVVTGRFRQTVNFGGSDLTSVGERDIFVAKFAGPDGTHLWSRRFGSSGTDGGSDLVVDGNGDVLVTGFFEGTVDFGGRNLTGTGGLDIFVAKLSGADGAPVWSKKGGSTGHDGGSGIGVDDAGDVIVAGSVCDNTACTVDFSQGFAVASGNFDFVVAKFSAVDGAVAWQFGFGGASDVRGLALRVDTGGDVLATGVLHGTVNFGGEPLTSVGVSDIFVAKFAGADGAHLWSKRFGGTESDEGVSIAVGGSDVLVTGKFRHTVDFGGGALSSAGSDDVFVLKLAGADGAHVWSKRFGSLGSDVGFAVTADGSGNVTVTGYFEQTVDFGGGPLPSAGERDIFLLGLRP